MSERGLRVIYWPFQREPRGVADFYRALDAYWVTSRIEGGPVPLLESMATGVPVVSTPVGVALEAIEEGVNGFVRPFEAPDAFAEESADLSGDHARLARLGQAARARMVQDFGEAASVQPARLLYDVAIANFRERTGRDLAPSGPPAWRDGELVDLPKASRLALRANDQSILMDQLINAGAMKAAREVALSAVSGHPLDSGVARRALSAFPRLREGMRSIRRPLRLPSR